MLSLSLCAMRGVRRFFWKVDLIEQVKQGLKRQPLPLPLNADPVQ